jgi:hypothetical protein
VTPDPHRVPLALDPPESVEAAFAGAAGVEFVRVPNDPNLREVASFLPLFEPLAAAYKPGDVALWAHAKGTTRHPGHVAGRWAEVMAESLLDYWPAVADVLAEKPLAGSFLKYGPGWRPTDSRSDWHYSGSWFWFRCADLFGKPDWRRIDQFWSGIEPFGKSWVWDFYTYWWEMRGSPPRGQTWGNSFIRDRNLKVEKGRWICVEQMIQMNDVGESNGEQALWIDGELVSHLGKGFPKGLWTYDKFTPGKGGGGIRWDHAKSAPERFTIAEGGAPFEGFRWRTVPELNVNYVWLYIYTEKPAGHRIKVWYDDVVVATSYIGPMRER